MTTQQFYYQQMLRQNTLRAYAAAIKNYTAAAGIAEEDTPTPPPVAQDFCLTIDDFYPIDGSIELYWNSWSVTPPSTLQYRLNDGEWTNIVYSYDPLGWRCETSIPVQYQSTPLHIYFRTTSKLSTFSVGESDYFYFQFSNINPSAVSISGNLAALIDPDSTVSLPSTAAYAFYKLFSYDSTVKNAIRDVSQLVFPTGIAPHCYHRMFDGCTNLSGSITLPATNLDDYCYNSMLRDTKLSSMHVKFTSWEGSSWATNNWVAGIPSGGTFYCPSALQETHGDHTIPAGWTRIPEN